MTDDYNTAAIVKAISQFPTTVDEIVKLHSQPELAPPFYDARAISIPAGAVVELFSYDASRIRFYVRVLDETAIVQIGGRDNLASGYGFVVRADALEMHTVSEVYVTSNADVTVYLWAEYRKR